MVRAFYWFTISNWNNETKNARESTVFSPSQISNWTSTMPPCSHKTIRTFLPLEAIEKKILIQPKANVCTKTLFVFLKVYKIIITIWLFLCARKEKRIQWRKKDFEKKYAEGFLVEHTKAIWIGEYFELCRQLEDWRWHTDLESILHVSSLWVLYICACIQNENNQFARTILSRCK